MMMIRFFAAYLELLCLVLLTFGGVEVVAGQRSPRSILKVKLPNQPAKELDHRDSLFGRPPYGATIVDIRVYYANDQLCDYMSNAGEKVYPKPLVSPFILLVDRGGCTFVKKIRNAQMLGAAAAIIADNTCLCSDKDCMTLGASCETAEPIMADDGSGADISIPSMLIFKPDADALIQQLKNNNNVFMEMRYELPPHDHRVEYDLFAIPTDAVSKSFLTSWKPMAKAFGTRAYFTPHMYIYDGENTHCLGDNGQSQCFSLCTNAGRYCATDPDNDLEKGISGADVVTESLRRICIWRKYGEEDGIGEVWWDYISEFEFRCSQNDLFASEDCIQDIYSHIGVEGDAIARCMMDSGGLENNVRNSILDQAIAAQRQTGVVVIPTVFVNTVALRGVLSAESVFGAVCSGFAEGSAPEVCGKCVSCPWDLATCVASNACAPDAVGGSTASFSRTNTTESGSTNVSNTGTGSSGNASGSGSGTTGSGLNSPGGGSTIGGSKTGTGQQASGGSSWVPDHTSKAPMNYDDDKIRDNLEALFGVLESFGGSETCGLNFEELAESSSGGYDHLLHSIQLDEQCDSTQEKEFLSTLESFEACSGWDIKEVIETLPSALVGSGMRCFMVAMTLTEDEAFSETMVTECAGVVLGDNPLGNALKRLLLEPDKNCECMGELSEVPECELDEWPIPIFGSGMKTWSCILTTFGCGYLVPFCNLELAALDGCLPKGNNTDGLCNAASRCENSVLLSLPPSLAGMPIPDACLGKLQN